MSEYYRSLSINLNEQLLPRSPKGSESQIDLDEIQGIIERQQIRENKQNPFIYRWLLKFSLHLSLISMFEALFFWQFVSRQEDNALISLVNSYAVGLINGCRNLTAGERAIVQDLLNLIINQTIVDNQGAIASQSRADTNFILQRNSWLYSAGLFAFFLALAGGPVLLNHRQDKRAKCYWGYLIGENIALVTLLGLYEWMFFKTIIFRYQAVSIPELDQIVTGEIEASC
jgi:hypothetical protein